MKANTKPKPKANVGHMLFPASLGSPVCNATTVPWSKTQVSLSRRQYLNIERIYVLWYSLSPIRNTTFFVNCDLFCFQYFLANLLQAMLPSKSTMASPSLSAKVNGSTRVDLVVSGQRYPKWITCVQMLFQAVPSPRGGFGGLSPPKQSQKPHQIEIRNIIN